MFCSSVGLGASRSLGLALVGLVVAAPATAGDFDYVDIFRNVTMHQTADGPALDAAGAFFSVAANTQGLTDYRVPGATRSVLLPDGSMLDLSAQSLTRYGYQSVSLPTLASMDATFPQGLYEVTLDDGITSVSASFSAGPANHYAGAAPYLAGSGWSMLQGMDVGNGITVPVSAFIAEPGLSFAYEFFTLYDHTLGVFVFEQGFLPPTTTGIFVPANTLLPGHSFSYELIFSSRVLVPSAGTNFDAQISYDLRTDGQFSTAVPEPGAWLMLLGGFAVLGRRFTQRGQRADAPAQSWPAAARPA